MKKLSVLITALFLLSGCIGLQAQSPNQRIATAFKALTVAADTYHTGMKTAGDLYRSGRMGTDTRDKIIDAANRYRKAHAHAVDALETYSKNNDDPAAVDEAIIALSAVLAEFIALVPMEEAP